MLREMREVQWEQGLSTVLGTAALDKLIFHAGGRCSCSFCFLLDHGCMQPFLSCTGLFQFPEKTGKTATATEQFPISWVNWISPVEILADVGRPGRLNRVVPSYSWRWVSSGEGRNSTITFGRGELWNHLSWPAAFRQTAGWTVSKLLFDTHQWQLRPSQIAGTWPNPHFFFLSHSSMICAGLYCSRLYLDCKMSVQAIFVHVTPEFVGSRTTAPVCSDNRY